METYELIERLKSSLGNTSSKFRQVYLSNGRLYVKLSKCEFWIDKVAFPRHVATKEGITVGHLKWR